jgi:hypothetical protein
VAQTRRPLTGTCLPLASASRATLSEPPYCKRPIVESGENRKWRAPARTNGNQRTVKTLAKKFLSRDRFAAMIGIVTLCVADHCDELEAHHILDMDKQEEL